jgi:hypothetical protein
VPKTKGLYQIDYKVVLPYSEEWRPDGGEATITCDTAWDTSDKFVIDMLGWSEFSTGSGITRHGPEPHPFLVRMWATEARLIDTPSTMTTDAAETFKFVSRDFTDPSQVPPNAPAGKARYQVTFRALDYNPSGTSEFTDWTRKTTGYAGQNVIVPGNTLQWASDSQPLFQNATIIQPSREITYLWHDVPSDPATAYLPAALETNIIACVGRVNTSTFDGHPAETLLCLPPDLRPKKSAAQQLVYDITYKFLRLDASGQTWNKLLRPGAFAYAAVQRIADTSNGPYLKGTFTNLWRVV